MKINEESGKQHKPDRENLHARRAAWHDMAEDITKNGFAAQSQHGADMTSHSASHSCCSGCDRDDVENLPLTDLPDALAKMTSLVEPISQSEHLPLGQCLGRVLAQDVSSQIPLPVDNNSAVDGYAVRLSAFEGQAPYSLPVGGRVAAGDDAGKIAPDSVCIRILTGAPAPDWTDAIIMQEDTQLSEDGSTATFSQKPYQHANIRFRGEDVPKGSVIIEAGAKIDTRHIAIAASSGLAKLKVTRPIKVALLATGSELNQPGTDLPPGGIYDSNTPMLIALLSQPHIQLTLHRPVKDDFETIRSSIASLAQDHDLLLTSGGMSVSDEDYIRRAIMAEAGFFEVKKVRLKPGKPLGFGLVKNCIFVGLPGNPFAALVGFLLFAQSAIAHLAGLTERPEPLLGAADFETEKGGKRLEFIPVRLAGYDESGRPKLEKIGKGGSARLRPLIHADGLAALPISDTGIRRGDLLSYYPFHSAFEL
ncbi:MAG: molybdopterin molybdotransferase MoeA [Cohaesibacter sp.]|jgi:molybdopterin molybdotransferase|nr:molybdopterin molybdotransferase MoeA [Cohaesibacter sp.]